jgi:hypothetical protein
MTSEELDAAVADVHQSSIAVCNPGNLRLLAGFGAASREPACRSHDHAVSR